MNNTVIYPESEAIFMCMAQAPEKQVYITQKDAAERLAVSTGTVRRLVKENKLEAYRFGNQIRIVRSSLDAYIMQQKISSCDMQS